MALIIILLVLGPGLMGSAIHCRAENIPMKSVNFFIYALIYAFLIQLFVYAILYLRGHGINAPQTIFDSTANIVKYAALSLAAALLFPGIAAFLVRFKRSKK